MIISRYFYDVWLCLYKFSKFMKTGVNLLVPNYRVFRIYVRSSSSKSLSIVNHDGLYHCPLRIICDSQFPALLIVGHQLLFTFSYHSASALVSGLLPVHPSSVVISVFLQGSAGCERTPNPKILENLCG